MGSFNGDHSTDLVPAQQVRGGLSVEDLEGFLLDMRSAPSWRARADMECDYYDSNQHTPDEIARAERLGLPVVTINLIFSTINMILGMEAKTRTDWTVLPDGPRVPQEYADALTVKITEAERTSRADNACADAYASMIKAGVGWVYVGKSLDPFAYPYVCENVDRREIWWDMRGKKPDTTDWRYLVRRKWHDCDFLKALLPKNINGTNVHQLIDAVANDGRAHWDYSNMITALPLAQDGLIDRDWSSWSYDDWRDTERRRAMLYEVWYRKYERGMVMKLPDGRVVEYLPDNPVHVAAVGVGAAVPFSALITRVRLSWWLGPFRLYDLPSPYKHPYFPYVPFYCYREDKTGVPYGQIRVMVSMQDEVNARRSKMLWQLSASRVVYRKGAIADVNHLRKEINRPDAMVGIEDNEVTRNKPTNELLEITDHEGMSAQQFSVYTDSKDALQQSAGVYGPMLGDAKSGADAGVAIDMLIQQGTTTLAEPNDNYRTGRMLAGEQMLSLISQDMEAQETEVKLPDDHPRTPGKRVILNRKQTDPDSDLPYLSNDTTRLRSRVALAEVPSSPTYQQQVFAQISQMLAKLPPNLQPIVIDLWVQASNVPGKQKIAERLRLATGQPGPAPDPENMTPEELAAAQLEQAAAQQRQQQEQQQHALEIAGMEATVMSERAATTLTQAQTMKVMTTLGDVEGELTTVVMQPDMQGAAKATLKKEEPPPSAGAPGGGMKNRKDGRNVGASKGNERDSTTMQRQ